MSEAPTTVGATVASARAARGLTVASVAASTRVRAAVIEAIERDDFSLCGGDVYARGHLKSIATAVGLDPAALAAAYDAQRGNTRAVAAPVEPVEQPTAVSDLSSASDSLGALAGSIGASVAAGRRGPNWSAVMGLALAVVLAVGTISFLSNRSSSGDAVAAPTGSSSPSATAASTPATTPTSSATSTPSAEPTESATPETSPTDVVAQADGVVVRLTVTGKKSWVRATGTGGKTLYEGLLSEGDSRTFKDKQKISLVVGNAGAVELRVNGRDLGSPGSGGQVFKGTFGPGDPTATAG